jgi:signal transduction histidine kinase
MMVKGNDNLSQIKSLSPFIYRRTVHLRESDLNDIIGGLNALLPQRGEGYVGLKTVLSNENLKVMADVARMQEVLLHLVRNGRDSMPSGGLLTIKTGKITASDASILSVPVSGVWALCSVSDTGIGMDTATRNRVFDPFFTTKSTSCKGLGLPIAQHIVKQHGGTIDFESRPGKGTTVTVYLPLVGAESGVRNPIPLSRPVTNWRSTEALARERESTLLR